MKLSERRSIATIATSPVSKAPRPSAPADRKSTRLNSSHSQISYAVFCLKKKESRRRQTYASPLAREAPYIPRWRPDERAASQQRVISDDSDDTAVHALGVSAEITGQSSDDQVPEHISDTATRARPPTPVIEVRSIGVNTQDMTAATVPSQPLRQTPSRAALLPNIRGFFFLMLTAPPHTSVFTLPAPLPS